MLSMTHMVVLFIVVLVVFGPQKLPELARGLGKLMAEFRKASTDFRSAFEQEMREIERSALQAERKKAAEAAAAAAMAASASQPAALPAPAAESAPLNPDAALDAEAGPAEAPVITPVAEAIPRSEVEAAPSTPAQTTAEPAETSPALEATQDHEQLA